MNRTLLTVALALTISLVFLSGAMAQQKQSAPMTSTPKAATSEKLEKFAGVISKVDDAKKEIAVKTNAGKEMTFTWSDQTKFMEGKKDVTFSDLKEGMYAAVQYKKEGDKFTAEKINVKAQHAAKKSPSEKSS